MSRLLLPLLVLAVLVTFTRGADSQQPTDADQRYQALVQQFKQTGRSPQLVEQFISLAHEYPDDPAAVDALAWIVVNVRDSDQAAAAVQLLLNKVLNDSQLKKISKELIKTPSLKGEELLRGLADTQTNEVVKAASSFYLAELLREQVRLHAAVSSQPAARRRFEQFYGKEFTRRLLDRDLEPLKNEIEQLYDRVVTEFADADEDLTKLSRTQLNEIRHLAIGKPAMEIEGEDIAGDSLKLSDFRGKVVVLSFWGHW